MNPNIQHLWEISWTPAGKYLNSEEDIVPKYFVSTSQDIKIAVDQIQKTIKSQFPYITVWITNAEYKGFIMTTNESATKIVEDDLNGKI